MQAAFVAAPARGISATAPTPPNQNPEPEPGAIVPNDNETFALAHASEARTTPPAAHLHSFVAMPAANAVMR
jgi:hypothetical protein